MSDSAEVELRSALEKVMRSHSRKKLIVAGPGTGKTTLFKELLKTTRGDSDSRLVLTFIRSLADDLGRSLGSLARVSTLHGYCQALLHRDARLRGRLSESFRCVPGLASVIKADWEIAKGTTAPEFVQTMRNLLPLGDLDFYFDRADHYDAVDFDDSVYRTLLALKAHPAAVEALDLLLIDEFQDFNAMEAQFVEVLGATNPVVVAGDDDQALYSQLRSASWDYIRALAKSKHYEVFTLPFCMRCPEVIVSAVSDIVTKARALLKLEGRIEKPYKHFPPKKGEDSRRYPKISLIESTVQTANANYLGRYIAEAIKSILPSEIEEAARGNEPTALVIGPVHYLDQIEDALVGAGFAVERGSESPKRVERAVGLEVLATSPASNIGWRIVLAHEKPAYSVGFIRESCRSNTPLAALLPKDYRTRILTESAAWVAAEKERKAREAAVARPATPALRIKLTSFEGSKGLSAQHVYVVGLQDGVLPKKPGNIQDIEVCRLLVGITRTKKRCCLLFTRRFAGVVTQPSRFIAWIEAKRYDRVRVSADYWKK